mmetsp:Transcript_34955/g.63978  ORF Transcript_34955/g.63978 Transcript_34955/m.63978 type:complete len:128 (-) Transcript_34955:22-405(-)
MKIMREFRSENNLDSFNINGFNFDLADDVKTKGGELYNMDTALARSVDQERSKSDQKQLKEFSSNDPEMEGSLSVFAFFGAHLIHVSLGGCCFIEGDIQVFGENSPSLERLNLAQCRFITDIADDFT